MSLLAEKHPIRIVSLRPGVRSIPDPKLAYAEYSTHIEMEAGYDQLGAFLQDLENSFATGEIRQLEIAGGDPTRQERRVSFDIALLMRPEAPPEKPSAPAVKKSEPKVKS